jgi:transcriptional regulator GlxA family with amidase domain
LANPLVPAKASSSGTGSHTPLFAFVLIDKVSMFTLSAAVDVLFAANRALGRAAYRWTTVSVDGEAVRASNGLAIAVDGPLAHLHSTDYLFVCAGLTLDIPGKQKLVSTLRQFDRRKIALGALSTGTHILAEAGVLNGFRCTIHWENRAGFAERFPDIECTANIYEIDRNRYTSAGVLTSMDLMLAIVQADHGADLANEIANQFQHERIRSTADRQRVSVERDLASRPEKLRQIVRLMADHVSDPLTASDLALAAELSVRQIERLFLRHLGISPGAYYMQLRLEHARTLLLQTSLPVLEIAVATGFASHSHFAQSYRNRFGHPPSSERQG